MEDNQSIQIRNSIISTTSIGGRNVSELKLPTTQSEASANQKRGSFISLTKHISHDSLQLGSAHMQKKLKSLESYLSQESLNSFNIHVNTGHVEKMLDSYFRFPGLLEELMTEEEEPHEKQHQQTLKKAKYIMKKQGINYQKFKKNYQKQHPEEFRLSILSKKEDLEKKFVKPQTLMEYEKNEDFKIYDDKVKDQSPQKLAQPKLSLNEIIADRKLKEKKRFRMIPHDERNKSMPELFKMVEETKKCLEEGSLTLNQCYEVMVNLQQSVKDQNVEIDKMYKIAEDLLYEAKCQVAIGDEDPKDANPQFSIKAFKEYMKQHKTIKVQRKDHSQQDAPSLMLHKQKKRKEFGGIKVERETNKEEDFAQQAQEADATINEEEQQRILDEFKYQKFKESLMEFDTHQYFISKENQLVKPSYMFSRKNSYLQYVSQTAKKQKNDTGGNRHTLINIPQEVIHSNTTKLLMSPQLSVQTKNFFVNSPNRTQISSPQSSQKYAMHPLIVKQIYPPSVSQHQKTITSNNSAINHQRNPSVQSIGRIKPFSPLKNQETDSVDCPRIIQFKTNFIQSQKELQKNQSRQTKDNLIITNIEVIDEAKAGAKNITLESVEKQQQVKVIIEKRPPTQDNNAFPRSQERNIGLKGDSTQSREEKSGRKVVYSSSQLRKYSNSKRDSFLEQLQEQQYKFKLENSLNKKENKMEEPSLGIRSLVPNVEIRKSMSSKGFREKPKPQIIRNASQTKNLFMLQRNKVKKDKFNFDREIIKKAEIYTSKYSSHNL